MGVALHKNQIVAGYRLEALLGQGGYGTVWRARDPELGRRVAIKFLNVAADPSAIERFIREARILGQLAHPNCLTLFDLGQLDDGSPYLVTELLRGQTLREWSESSRSVDEVVGVAIQLVDALGAAHALGVEHRDIKPENVMIAEIGGQPLVKLLDFGIARLAGSVDITKTGVAIGTPHYMSPERLKARRDTGPAADQYSLGVVLYELLAGRLPFDGDNVVVLAKKHMEEPPPKMPPDVPGALQEVVLRALSKDPADRFESIDALGKAIYRAWAPDHVPTEALPAASTQPPPQQPPTKRIVLALLSVAAVSLVYLLATRESPAPALPHRPTTPPRVRFVPTSQERGADPVATVPQANDCMRPAAGLSTIRWLDGLTARQLLVYFPKNYDADREHALIALLRDGGNWREEEFLSYTAMIEIAERYQAVLVAPVASRSLGRSWSGDSVEEAWADIVGAREHLCTDVEQLFILGKGAGARAADELVCAHGEEITAVAVTAHRYPEQERPCEAGPAVPVLNLVQTRNRLEPVEGGIACPGAKHRFWSAERHDEHWHERHGCRGAPSIEPQPGGECMSWDCDTAYVSCRIDAGRDWSSRPRTDEELACVGKASKLFPYQQVAWEFWQDSRGAPGGDSDVQ